MVNWGRFWGGGKLSLPQRWALAAGACCAVPHGDRLDCLPRCVFDAQEARTSLAEWWGAHNREGCLRQIDWLENEGHNAHFSVLHRQLCGLEQDGFETLVQDLSAEAMQQAHFVWVNLDEFKDGHIVAWDLARLIDVVRFGVTAEYLREAESWPLILRVAERIQGAYRSWDELGRNFALGAVYWLKGVDSRPDVAEGVKWLLTQAESPWRQLAWSTPLK
ncbi:MAG: DUF1266 domain-containing protein [Phycisphaerae bacterium]|jgi:hypothetical protein